MARVAATLTQRLATVRQKASGDVHLRLLETFEAHGRSASPFEAVDLLVELRAARDVYKDAAQKQPRGPRVLLAEWDAACRQHPGFQLMRERLFGDLQSLNGKSLSRAYNHFRRLYLAKEAEEVWPQIKERLAKEQMNTLPQLLGIWSVAPQEHMSVVDAPLAKAIEEQQGLRTWQLLSALSRTTDWPEARVPVAVAKRLVKNLEDLSSGDLSLILGQLGSGQDLPEPLPGLLVKARRLLMEKGGDLQPVQLVGMLGYLQGFGDLLWPLVRDQLLQQSVDLSIQQHLAVCRFLHSGRLERGSARLAGKEAQLFSAVVKQLQGPLRGAQPGLVDMVARDLDCLVLDLRICQILLNAAARFRKDLFPGALWKLFVRCGEVDLLSYHPSLQGKLQVIGQQLEEHGLSEQTPLSEMAAVAYAMLRTGVVLKNCTRQMVERSQAILQRTEEEETDGSGRWLEEVQRLVVNLWTHLKCLGAEEETRELDVVVEGFCEQDADCRLDLPTLFSCTEQLRSLPEGANKGVDRVLDGLSSHLAAKLLAVKSQELMTLTAEATAPRLRATLTREALRRLDYVAQIKRAEDFEHIATMLTCWTRWLQEEQASFPGPVMSPLLSGAQLERVAQLLTEALPRVLQESSNRLQPCLSSAVAALTPLQPKVVPLAPLRAGLAIGADLTGKWEPAAAADLSYSMAALHGGSLPFPLNLHLWRYAGRVVLARGSPVGLPSAKLWAFALAARHLSSRTAWAAMKQADEAGVLEEFVGELEMLGQASLRLGEEPGASVLLERLRPILPRSLEWEDGFQVPGTPFVADIALREQRLLLVVPRAAHRAVGGEGALSGAAQLMESTLKALGWRLLWLLQEDVSPQLDALGDQELDLARGLRSLLGLDTGVGEEAALAGT